jgi:hypothetical protein
METKPIYEGLATSKTFCGAAEAVVVLLNTSLIPGTP